MNDEPAASESQEMRMVIDSGEESFSVDLTAKSEEKPAETPTSGEEDGKEEDGKAATDADKSGSGEDEGKGKDKEPDDSDVPEGVKKKIDKLTWKRREAERENDRLRAENEALKAEKNAPRPEEVGPKPSPADFQNDADYIEALTDWKVKKALSESQAKDAERIKGDSERRQQEAKESRERAVKRSMAEASERYEDFDKVVFRKEVPITETMVDIMSHFDNLGDVAYHLGKNPDMAVDIASMPVIEASFVLKDLSDTLKGKTKKVTNTPDPIKPVKPSGGGVKSLDNMPYPEYRKLMEKRDKERRGG